MPSKQSQPPTTGEAAHKRRARVGFVRVSLCPRPFEVEVRTPSRRLLARFQGTPLELFRVLPAIRYAVRKMNGPVLREYLQTLQRGFWTWQARAALSQARPL